MFSILDKIWYTYAHDVFFSKGQSKLSKELGWEVVENKHRAGFSESIEKLYKNHIMIKHKYIEGYNINLCNAYSVYITNDINDPDPALIYYCYDYSNAAYSARKEQGWINIGNWSIFAKQLIDNDSIIIKNYKRMEEFNEVLEKEKEFTKYIKPELSWFFKDKVSSLDIEIFLKLAEDVLHDKKLNDCIRIKDREDAKNIINKLKGED